MRRILHEMIKGRTIRDGREVFEVPVCVAIRMYVSTRFDVMEGEIPKHLSEIEARASEVLSQIGLKVLHSEADVHPVSASELIVIMPRKKHKRAGSMALCLNRVARENIVEEDDEVTCKVCLGKMKAATEGRS